MFLPSGFFPFRRPARRGLRPGGTKLKKQSVFDGGGVSFGAIWDQDPGVALGLGFLENGGQSVKE